MYTINFRTPARRWSAAAVACALTAGPVALAGAAPAYATEGHGHASASVLRTDLDVSLLNKSVQVPLTVSLNEVEAPNSARKTALTATLDGVDRGRPFSVLRAEVADAVATVEGDRAEASTTLADARLQVPGLPLLSLVELEAVGSKAVCETGRTPHASVTLPAAVTVLGKRVSLSAGGPTHVDVPGVGSVRLDLSTTGTTSSTAAATALKLEVSVNPAKLNVAEVEGRLTLAESRCETPAAAAEDPEAAAPEAPEAPEKAEPAVEPQGARAGQAAPAETNLAETGGDSATPYVAAGAVALLAAGGGAVLLSRRGRRN
ncbi:SCO1860 family LAETG-anchored protein [Streptomyces griseoincarnatus]|uniref:SCO1860 family LAETG-anchored protein n=1 Tax=unclassified Streptomyces TaxID=2593676 RepID=UPI000C8846B1|nr:MULTISPECIES: SCO1860 family LAETG-anchored protein [unclassified Streptomyces]MBJ6646799.1 LPXTG cell wall anchor domain-containing protein [Streptomyces sp. BSE7-9]MCA2202708.1 LPXTG cell wall anchor domain-containing protein [Streptomyces sp. SMS_SU21]NEA92415.1 LPXTG cell wall anchor domain-containing protein [Actinospica acidiphila]